MTLCLYIFICIRLLDLSLYLSIFLFRNKDRNLALTNREKEIFATSGLLSPLFRARGRSRNFLRLEFSNGTACDLDNMNRSSVVEIYCGPS